jgi:hypothetical protein
LHHTYFISFILIQIWVEKHQQHPNTTTRAKVDNMPGVLEHSVTTEVPGPLSKAAAKKLDAFFDSRAVHFVVDYDKSEGN